jgi:hypothetical protein
MDKITAVAVGRRQVLSIKMEGIVYAVNPIEGYFRRRQ